MPARRTSNRMKVLNGTDRPDRIRKEPFDAVAEAPEPPDWIAGPEAESEFRDRAADLVDAGVMTAAAVTQLAHYCNLHGAIVAKWRANMAPTAAELTQLRLMATEFGFTPASRSKAGGGTKSDSGNAFAELSRKSG